MTRDGEGAGEARAFVALDLDDASLDVVAQVGADLGGEGRAIKDNRRHRLPRSPLPRRLAALMWVTSQCRKCRSPVNTIASPSRSAAAITSSSRRLPPGWMTTAAPAAAAASTPSGKG